MPILKSEDFSNARASFFVRLSIKFGVSTEKNNGIWGNQIHCGSVSPCPLLGGGCIEPGTGLHA